MTQTRRHLLLSALPAAALLAGCEATPLPPADPNVALPRDAVAGAGDPTRAAIIHTAFGFGRGAPFAGMPAEAAQAVAELEFLSNSLVTDPRYTRDPLVAVRFADARPEWRGAVGIAPNAPAQLVIENLFAFARNPATPLSPSIFAPDSAQRLAALPAMPRTAAATAAAQQLLFRLDSDRGGGRGFLRF